MQNGNLQGLLQKQRKLKIMVFTKTEMVEAVGSNPVAVTRNSVSRTFGDLCYMKNTESIGMNCLTYVRKLKI